MEFMSTEELRATPMTKGELADKLYGDMTYDTAIPQGWLDDAIERGMDMKVAGSLASHFVMVYPAGFMPYVAPLTADGVKVCAILASLK